MQLRSLNLLHLEHIRVPFVIFSLVDVYSQAKSDFSEKNTATKTMQPAHVLLLDYNEEITGDCLCWFGFCENDTVIC